MKQAIRLDAYITMLEGFKKYHGNLVVCVDDGKSDMIWNALPPKLSKPATPDNEKIVVISPEI